MIALPIVSSCPYTKVGIGIIKFKHEVIAVLAGAVHDNREWLAFLVGRRENDGLTINVESLRVPLQKRDTGSCEFVTPEPLQPDIVGIVHSHHSMNAFFSQTDNTTLNPRFPVSIVIAKNRAQYTDEARLLGFSYKAEGRAPLPCGAMGIIEFTAIPDPLPESWPRQVQPGFGIPNITNGMGQCNNMSVTYQGTNQTCKGACGVEVIEPAVALFGRNGKDFLQEVQSKTRGTTDQSPFIHDKRFSTKYRKQHADLWDDEDRLLGWSELW